MQFILSMSANLSHPQVDQPVENHAWHTIEAQKTLWLLKSDRTHGLTQEQIDQNLQHYGTNELVETSGRSPLEIFWDQFKNIMLLMLIAVAIISMVLDVRESLVKGRMALRKALMYAE
nr:cation-transporting P-type ATPase [Nostoc favosum]